MMNIEVIELITRYGKKIIVVSKLVNNYGFIGKLFGRCNSGDDSL